MSQEDHECNWFLCRSPAELKAQAEVMAQAEAQAEAQSQTQAQDPAKVWVETVGRSLIQIAAGVDNQTEMIDTLKNRQAVASIAQATSLTIMLLWLIFLAARAIWVCVTKKQQAGGNGRDARSFPRQEESQA